MLYPILKSSKSFFCLKLKISISTEMIWFCILSKIHIGPVMFLGYFMFWFESRDGFNLFYKPHSAPLFTEPLDARGAPAGIIKVIIEKIGDTYKLSDQKFQEWIHLFRIA